MKPQFSFLTTAYQTERYLPRTIATVRAQTRQDWELVVVDNGNSEELAAIVREHAAQDPRIRLVRQENRGYRGGVMAAAEHARGRWFCVLDSDDHLMPEFCATVGALIDAEPGIGAVGVDAYRFRASEATGKAAQREPEDIDLPMGYMRSIGVTAAADPRNRLTVDEVLHGRVPYYTAAFRRDAWAAVGGYEPGVEDVDESVIIWVRLAAAYDVRLLPDKLARYRLRADSLSRDPAGVEAFERQLLRSFTEGARILGVPMDPRHLRGMRYHQEIRRARHALVTGDTASARAAARQAWRLRRTMRSGLILGSVTVAPGLMRRAHPVKQRLTDVTARMTGRVAGAIRR